MKHNNVSFEALLVWIQVKHCIYGNSPDTLLCAIFFFKLHGVYWTTFVKHSTANFILKISFNRAESPVDLYHMKMMRKPSSTTRSEMKKSVWKFEVSDQKICNFIFITNFSHMCAPGNMQKYFSYYTPLFRAKASILPE